MPRIRRLFLVALVLGAAVCAVGASSAAAASACRPEGSTTRKFTPLVLVVLRADGVTQACYRPTEKVTVLDDGTAGGRAGTRILPLAAAGSMFSYGRVRVAADGTGTTTVDVLDTRTGRRVMRREAYAGSRTRQPLFQSPLFQDSAMRADGLVIWSLWHPGERKGGWRSEPFEVRWAKPGIPDTTVLDTGSEPMTRVEYLAAGPERVYWNVEGDARSAAVPREPEPGEIASRPAEHESWCRPRGSWVLARTPQVRVIRRAGGRVQACQLRTGRTKWLQPAVEPESTTYHVTVLAIAGSRIAYRRTASIGRGGGNKMRIHVVDLAAGRRTTDCRAFSSENYGEVTGDAFTFDQVSLLPDGSFAWMITPPRAVNLPPVGSAPEDTQRQIWHAQPEHGCSLFNVGDTAEPGSMALNDSLLYWMDGGETIGEYLVASNGYWD